MSRPSAPPEAAERLRREIERLASFGENAGASEQRIAVAVSGGPDSLALLLLAQAAFPGRVLALTVDHGLRAESGDEAAIVARLCADLGVQHRTLPAPGLKERTANIQAEARTARYAAMESSCTEAGVTILMTAHHADDQAETLLMRLARGSGLSGLAGVRTRRAGKGVTIMRPLLGYRKTELAEIVRAAGLIAADDPSNRSQAYDRTHARALLAAAPWLDPLRITASADHLAEAEAALCWATELAWRGRAEWLDGTLALDMEDLPRELVRRLTVMAIAAINPEATPDGPSIDRLIDRAGQDRPSTLGNVRVSSGRKWRFAVAPPRRTENRTAAHCS